MPAFCNAVFDDAVVRVRLVDLRVIWLDGLEVIFGVVASPTEKMYHVIHYESGQKTRVVSLTTPYLALHKWLDDEIKFIGPGKARQGIEYLRENEWSVLNEINF